MKNTKFKKVSSTLLSAILMSGYFMSIGGVGYADDVPGSTSTSSFAVLSARNV